MNVFDTDHSSVTPQSNYTHRDVTDVPNDVPTFFVRMLGKLLEFTGIEHAIQDGGSPFKLAEHAQLIIFRQAA